MESAGFSFVPKNREEEITGLRVLAAKSLILP
jgi:hypothetical protein